MAPEDLLTADELAAEANRHLQELARTFRVPPQEVTVRAIYFYTREGILPRIRGLRHAKRYPASWVYRLLFVKRLQQEMPGGVREELEGLVGEDPSMLSGIAKVLDALSESRVRAIALGEEPVRVLPVSLAQPMEGSVFDQRAQDTYAMRSESRGPPAVASINWSERSSDDDWVSIHASTTLRVKAHSAALTPEKREELEVAARLLDRALNN